MFKRILCTTDGSEHGDRALRQAARMTRDSDGELHLVHVTERIPGGNRLGGQDVFLTEFETDSRIVRQSEEMAQQTGVMKEGRLRLRAHYPAPVATPRPGPGSARPLASRVADRVAVVGRGGPGAPLGVRARDGGLLPVAAAGGRHDRCG